MFRELGCVGRRLRSGRASGKFVRTGVMLHLDLLLAIAEQEELEPVPEQLSTNPRAHGGQQARCATRKSRAKNVGALREVLAARDKRAWMRAGEWH